MTSPAFGTLISGIKYQIPVICDNRKVVYDKYVYIPSLGLNVSSAGNAVLTDRPLNAPSGNRELTYIPAAKIEELIALVLKKKQSTNDQEIDLAISKLAKEFF